MGDVNQETASTSFVVELERFHGPLDLLLHLIREQNVDIFDIPIAQITSQFLQAIEDVAILGLDRAGEFLEMAATLIRIKAQMLLPRPRDVEGEFEDPRAELVRRLLEYEHFRDASRMFGAAESDRIRHFAKGYVPPRPKPQLLDTPLEVTWDDVWEAALLVGERVREEQRHRVQPRAVPLEDKITLILDSLERMRRVEFHKLVTPFNDRLHAVVTFVAGLELAKRRVVSLKQQEPFSPLWIYRRKRVEAEEFAAEVAAEVAAENAADHAGLTTTETAPSIGDGTGDVIIEDDDDNTDH